MRTDFPEPVGPSHATCSPSLWFAAKYWQTRSHSARGAVSFSRLRELKISLDGLERLRFHLRELLRRVLGERLLVNAPAPEAK